MLMLDQLGSGETGCGQVMLAGARREELWSDYILFPSRERSGAKFSGKLFSEIMTTDKMDTSADSAYGGCEGPDAM